MKSISIKMLALAVILAAGSAGLNAQNYRGNQFLRNQRGACVQNQGLSAGQQAEIKKLSDAHQKDMDALRTNLRLADNAGQRRTIRDQMDQIQASHRTKIVEMGATPANTPHSRFLGRGQGAGMGQGRGAGFGARRAAGGGRGLGPCGVGRF